MLNILAREDANDVIDGIFVFLFSTFKRLELTLLKKKMLAMSTTNTHNL